jgi:hypothetical protein
LADQLVVGRKTCRGKRLAQRLHSCKANCLNEKDILHTAPYAVCGYQKKCSYRVEVPVLLVPQAALLDNGTLQKLTVKQQDVADAFNNCHVTQTAQRATQLGRNYMLAAAHTL